MKLKLILLILMSFILCGCEDVEFDKPKTDSPTPLTNERVQILSRSQIAVKYIPTSEANIYDAQITWPSFDGFINFKNAERKYINERSFDQNQYLLKSLQGGIETTYFLEFSNSYRNQKSEIELKLLPPKDLVIQENMNLNQDLQLSSNRIFIKDSVRIYTNQFCLKMNFNKLLIGNDVQFANYPLNQKALANTKGRDGGCIQLSGQSAIGNLKIFLNSEAGGDGDSGFPRCLSMSYEDQNTDCYGEPGQDSGIRGSAIIQIENTQNLNLDYSFIEVSGGIRGLYSNYIQDPQARYLKCRNFLENSSSEAQRARYKTCSIETSNGKNASGGQICLKLSKDAQYECIDKN